LTLKEVSGWVYCQKLQVGFGASGPNSNFYE